MFRFWFVLCLFLGLGLAAFVFSKCGARTLMLGNGGAYAAFSGMCDK